MAFFDLNRDGKEDFFDDFLEYSIVQDMIEEEEQEDYQQSYTSADRYDNKYEKEESDWNWSYQKRQKVEPSEAVQKIDERLSIFSDDIRDKLIKMHNCNVLLDRKVMTWDFIRNDPKGSGQKFGEQRNRCLELHGVIDDILSNVDREQRVYVEKEVYSYVLNVSCQLCNEGSKLFLDYSGYKKLFDQGHNLVIHKKLPPEKFLDMIIDVDKPYRTLSIVQGFYAWELKEKLDAAVIYHDNDLRLQLQRLAQAYNYLIKSELERHMKFFSSPGVDHINKNWDMYVAILKGLPLSMIQQLDESGWMKVLDDQEKNQHGEQFKREFLMRRKQFRESYVDVEKDMIEEKSLLLYPNILKRFRDNRKKISEFQEQITKALEKQNAAQSTIGSLEDKIKELEEKIKESKQKMEEFSQRTFFKKHAIKKIVTINKEIDDFQQQIQELKKQRRENMITFSNKKIDEKRLRREVEAIEGEQERLKRAK